MIPPLVMFFYVIVAGNGLIMRVESKEKKNQKTLKKSVDKERMV